MQLLVIVDGVGGAISLGDALSEGHEIPRVADRCRRFARVRAPRPRARAPQWGVRAGPARGAATDPHE